MKHENSQKKSAEESSNTASEPDLHRDFYNTEVERHFRELMQAILIERPGDRSPFDRTYSVLLTEVQKIYGYYMWECIVWGNKEEEVGEDE